AVLGAATLAAGVVAVREASPVPLNPTAGCEAAAAAGPWKAVFGTQRTTAAAVLLVRKAQVAGFKNLALVLAGPNQAEVDLFGIPKYGTGLELVREARSAALQVSIQPSRDRYCPDGDGDWEGVFGHRTAVTSAITLQAAALKAGFVGAAIERDGLRDYEV